ncbi:Lactamase-like protein nscB [Cladobotryum mycophilum]|uniref:Lactamase-like protein nscB n=1 Tax=Cladobotryum mycophilum TaxID=491253 RepID=A0ABR0SLV9_9HYPO
MATSLQPLPAVERLSPRCIRILGGNPGKFTLQGTNTYLLGTGRRRILIDTGEGRQVWVESLKATLAQENATVEAALISHWHRDHTGGIEDLLSAFPGTTIYKNDPDLGQSALRDGDQFQVDGITLKAIHTPGHTKDHVVFLLAEEDAMFTADNVLGQGTAVFEDLSTYIESLGKMRTLFSGRAYPGHGPVVDNGPGKIAEYIEHRREREEQVLRTMRTAKPAEGDDANIWTAMGIVKVVYRDVPQELHPAACGGVLQILFKLGREGRVVQVGEDGWHLQDRSTL